MVDLGQKKVDSYPPFFMTRNQIKKACPVSRASFFYADILILNCYSIALAYLAATSFQSITLKNALI
jgi:uncharacterized protein Veg